MNARNHICYSHFSRVAAEQLRLILAAQVLHDRLRLRQSYISIHEVWDIGEIEPEVPLLVVPWLHGSFSCPVMLVQLLIVLDAKICE